jgi:hypothetical protein
VLGASTASAAAPKFTNRYVTVKIAGSQKTTWQASPVARCSGHQVACGKDLDDTSGPCIGRKAFDTNAALASA